MALEAVGRGNLEAVPKSEVSLLVRTLSPHEQVGRITVGEDGGFEAIHVASGFVGVHRTLSEALDAIAERLP